MKTKEFVLFLLMFVSIMLASCSSGVPLVTKSVEYQSVRTSFK